MKTLLIVLVLLLPACELTRDTAARGAPALSAQAPKDTLDTTVRRVSAPLDVSLDTWFADMTITPDGRSGVLTDWTMGDVAVVDVERHTLRRLTQNTASWEPGGSSGSVPVSRDGRYAAYAWWSADSMELRTIPVAGGSPRVLYRTGSAEWVDPKSWSPDDRHIAAVHYVDRHIARIILIPTAGGTPRVIRTLDWRGATRADFSRDGRHLVYDRTPDSESQQRDIMIVDLQTEQEHVLLASAQDEALMGWVPDADAVLFTSERGGTTGLYMQGVANGRAAGDPVLVRPDFWRTRPSGFAADGRFFYAVALGGVNAVAASFDPGTGALTGSHELLDEPHDSGVLPGFSVSGRAESYMAQRDRTWHVFVRTPATAEPRAYPLPIRLRYVLDHKWTANDGAIIVHARTQDLRNVAYRLDLASGRGEIFELSAAEGEVINALDVLPDGHTILLRRRTAPVNGSPNIARLYLHDLRTGTERRVFEVIGAGFDFAISPDGANIAVLRTSRGSAAALQILPTVENTRPRTVGPNDDARPGWLAWHGNNAVLRIVRDSVDNTKRTVTRAPLDGGAVTRSTLTFDAASRVVFSPDGTRLAYTTCCGQYELWVLEGLKQAMVSGR